MEQESEEDEEVEEEEVWIPKCLQPEPIADLPKQSYDYIDKIKDMYSNKKQKVE